MGEKSARGQALTLTVFAMHVFVGVGWGGNGGGVVQDSISLSDCLTGKLHPSYLNENRGVNMSKRKTEKRRRGKLTAHKGKQQFEWLVAVGAALQRQANRLFLGGKQAASAKPCKI